MNVSRQQEDLMSALCQQGVLIKLSISIPRFSKKLRAEDLGLDPERIPEDLISFGNKKLIRKEVMNEFYALEAAANALVRRSSFSFMNGVGRFLPNVKISNTIAGLDHIKNQVAELKRTFLNDYNSHIENAMQMWEEFADRNPDINKQRLLSEVDESFPDLTKLTRMFRFEWHLFQVRLPEELQLTVTDAADAMAVAAARSEAANAAKRMMEESLKGFVADSVATMRKEVVELADEMLAAMDDGKLAVHQKTLNRMSKFIDHFKQMNFADDGQLESTLEKLRTDFLNKNASEYRDDEFALAAFKGSLRKMSERVKALAEEDRDTLIDQFTGQFNRVIEVEKQEEVA